MLGDVRPHNFLMTHEGTLKIVDIGSLAGESSAFLRTYFNKEKTYLAPEVIIIELIIILAASISRINVIYELTPSRIGNLESRYFCLRSYNVRIHYTLPREITLQI